MKPEIYPLEVYVIAFFRDKWREGDTPKYLYNMDNGQIKMYHDYQMAQDEMKRHEDNAYGEKVRIGTIRLDVEFD